MRLRFCNKDDLVVGLMMLGVLLFALSCSGGKGQGGDDDADDAEEASIQRVSVASDGTQSDDDSQAASISSDGNITALESFASTLVAGNITVFSDIYIHAIDTGTTERITDNINGFGSDGDSQAPSIDADGNFVAFQSAATDLVAGDANGRVDIFVYDTTNATTDLISLNFNGLGTDGDSTAPSISADGSLVAYQSAATDLVPGDVNGQIDIFVTDLDAGNTEIISIDVFGQGADGDSTSPSISADGRFVAFQSEATDLVFGDSNGQIDIFIWDRQNNNMVRINLNEAGNQAQGSDSLAPAISADGKFVAFDSAADNLVANDTNGKIDVFVAPNSLVP